MLKIENATKVYKTKAKSDVVALRNINLLLPNRGLVFILGQSGSGKTTLLNLIGGLDRQTSGNIVLENNLELGKDISLECYRKNYVGFVFQEYNLLENLNVFDNISLAVTYPDKKTGTDTVKKILKDVALEGYEKRRICELSGGQKQRIAIARALAQNSKLLLCDEPTGNLDSETGKEIFDLLKTISKDKLVIVATHNEEMAFEYANRIIRIKDGEIQADSCDKEDFVDAVQPVELKSKNAVSLRYKLKCGAINLFTHKFKTGIAFILLFLSIFTTCVMQVCLSYNSETAIAKSFNNESSIIVLKNNSSNDDVITLYERFPLSENLDTYIKSDNYSDGYRVSYGTVFLLDDKNINIVDNKEFYFKNNLADGFAYVTDYFVDLVVNINDYYTNLLYEDYTQLCDAEVVYKGHTLFKIAGIIKTDYTDFYDERGNEKPMPKRYNDKIGYLNDLDYKLNYQYKVTYTRTDTFENMYIDNSYISYSQMNGYSINAQNEDYSINLNNIQLYDVQQNNPIFYLDTGYYGMSNLPDIVENTEKRELAEDEIVINGSLYNRLFGAHIDWEEFYRQYYIALDSGSPMVNSLAHLNKIISINIVNTDGNVIEIKDKKVIGVNTEFSIVENNIYAIYGLKEEMGITNKLLAKHYVSELNWQQVSDKSGVLKSLREDSVLVAGVKASLIYEKEYIIRQMSYFFIGVAGILSLISIISIFNLVNAKIRDKKKEIGILVAIGLKKSEVNFIYMFSIICMMVLSVLLTISILSLVIFVVNTVFIIEPFGFISYFNFSWLTFIVIGITCLIMFFASLYPLFRITKQKPVELINA